MSMTSWACTVNFTLLSVLCVWFFIMPMAQMSSFKEYEELRSKLVLEEQSEFLGESVLLNDKENRLDQLILAAKQVELNDSYKDVASYLPLKNFLCAKDDIERSKIFQLIRKIPKGASLHSHLLASVSVDYIIKNITYRDHLYSVWVNGSYKLKFLYGEHIDNSSDWKLLKDERNKSSNFDDFLRSKFSLETENPEVEYATDKMIWKRFKGIFNTLYDLVSFKPVFEDFLYQSLKELYEDNIMWAEMKSTFMPLYDLTGQKFCFNDFLLTIRDVQKKFIKENPGFQGVRYIHSLYRGIDEGDLKQNLEELLMMKQRYPDLIVGFDLVGFEDEGKSLFDFAPTLLNYSTSLNSFFHAGETNWFGHTDLNVIDSILLNTKRLGHGLSLLKHPKFLRMAKEKNIPIEVCPISNQVLQLIKDPRTHPAATFMANGHPVVICNDDPSAWGASGLSYDWYVAFMAMTSRQQGLKILKQWAENSILYSAMDDTERAKALSQFYNQWNKFVDEGIEFMLA